MWNSSPPWRSRINELFPPCGKSLIEPRWGVIWVEWTRSVWPFPEPADAQAGLGVAGGHTAAPEQGRMRVGLTGVYTSRVVSFSTTLSVFGLRKAVDLLSGRHQGGFVVFRSHQEHWFIPVHGCLDLPRVGALGGLLAASPQTCCLVITRAGAWERVQQH